MLGRWAAACRAQSTMHHSQHHFKLSQLRHYPQLTLCRCFGIAEQTARRRRRRCRRQAAVSLDTAVSSAVAAAIVQSSVSRQRRRCLDGRPSTDRFRLAASVPQARAAAKRAGRRRRRR